MRLGLIISYAYLLMSKPRRDFLLFSLSSHCCIRGFLVCPRSVLDGVSVGRLGNKTKCRERRRELQGTRTYVHATCSNRKTSIIAKGSVRTLPRLAISFSSRQGAAVPRFISCPPEKANFSRPRIDRSLCSAVYYYPYVILTVWYRLAAEPPLGDAGLALGRLGT